MANKKIVRGFMKTRNPAGILAKVNQNNLSTSINNLAGAFLSSEGQ
jgi:hypothetical protein